MFENMLLQIVAILVFLLLTRLYVVLSTSSPKPRKRRDGETCSLAVFLGSGGHTGEVLMLVSSLDFCRYSPRIYIVSEGDTLSINKAISLEHSKATRSSPFESDGQSDYSVLAIPRARRVHQAIWTVLPTFIRSFLACINLVTIAPLLKKDSFGSPFADLLILNGPGTCVTLCAAVIVNKLFGLSHPKMMYVESYARVRSLSLSGKILRYIVDRYAHPVEVLAPTLILPEVCRSVASPVVGQQSRRMLRMLSLMLRNPYDIIAQLLGNGDTVEIYWFIGLGIIERGLCQND